MLLKHHSQQVCVRKEEGQDDLPIELWECYRRKFAFLENDEEREKMFWSPRPI